MNGGVMKGRLSSIVMVSSVSVVLLLSRSVNAIGPAVLLFHGGNLKESVAVTGADAALFPDITKPVNLTAGDIANRAFIDVAFFWGSLSNPANNGTPLKELRPEMAWQHGRFYPAAGQKPAVLVATAFRKDVQPIPGASTAMPMGGVVSDEAIAVLKKA